MTYALQKLGAKRNPEVPLTLRSEKGRWFRRPGLTLPPGPAAKLLSVMPHNCRRRFEPNADTAILVDVGALGGNAPDDILGGQYCCHRSPP